MRPRFEVQKPNDNLLEYIFFAVVNHNYHNYSDSQRTLKK